MPTAPYPILQDILNTARVRLNDAIQTPVGAPAGQIGGEVLNDNAIFTKQGVNAAFQRFQEFLVSLQFSRLVNTVQLTGLGPVGTTDPGIFAFIDWTGYNNGATLNPAIALPQDLSSPIRLKERVSGASPPAALEFTPMEYVANGLFGIPKGPRNFNWTWDSDKIKIPGATQAMDLELRYVSFIAAFEDVGSPISVHWYDQPVPIMRCEDAFAWYICSEFANARGDMDGAVFDTKAEAAATKLVQKEQQAEQLRKEWVIPAIPPATGATPYDSVATILNTVKTRLNALNAAASDILITNNPYMQQVFNTAWRRFQAFLANLGYIRMTKEVILSGLVPKTSQDPSVQVFIDWAGYNNGTVLDPTVAFPQDLILPMVLSERQNGMNSNFCDMTQWLDGMPTTSPTGFNRIWEWRGDTVYMPGANFLLDLRVRYAAFLPDFIENAPVAGPWYSQQVPIVRSLDSLSAYVCAEIAISRPDLELDAATFTQQGEDSARIIFNRDARQKQRVNVRRLSRSGRLDGYGNGYGFGGQW